MEVREVLLPLFEDGVRVSFRFLRESPVFFRNLPAEVAARLR
jgi:hypothetical protein